jgi:hypothetical protein
MSPYGKISCDWEKKDDLISIKVEIPVNTTAKVLIPLKRNSVITESGIEVSRVKEIKVLPETEGWMVYQVGSGSYSFIVK